MRISDWSSDVCSSDLAQPRVDLLCDQEGDRETPDENRIMTPRQKSRPMPFDLAFGFAHHQPGDDRRQDQRGADHIGDAPARAFGDDQRQSRSEEHTSETQSLKRISYAALCLKNK